LGEPQVDFSGEARIGAPFTVELTQAAPSSTAFLYLDLAGRPMDLGGGCSVYLPNPILSGMFPTDATGSLQLPFVIPGIPLLAGVNVWSQFLIVDPQGALNGASLSPALELVIGG
ncbi:MAG: hypothetical protein AAFZ65_18915, partial [Planctomycetota bacterium]